MKAYAPASADSTTSRLSEQFKEISASNKLSGILNKMRIGKRLSAAEKEYLRKNAPDAYRKYRMVEAERDAHRKRLDNAKSKKDAAQAQQAKLVMIYDECRGKAASIDSEFVASRAAAIKEEYREYREGKVKKPKPLPESTGKQARVLTKAGRKAALSKYLAQRDQVDS